MSGAATAALLPTTPLRAADVPEAWIEMVREVAQHYGHALRAGAGCTIEVQSINQPDFWPRLMLPNCGYTFASEADRDRVLRGIVGGR